MQIGVPHFIKDVEKYVDVLRTELKSYKLLVALLTILFLALVGLFVSRDQLGTGLSLQDSGGIVLNPSGTSALNLPTPFDTAQLSRCDCAWAISTTPNVEFLVTSPLGDGEGYQKESQTYLDEIPDASYGKENGSFDGNQQASMSDFIYFGMNDPVNGVYELEIIGKQPGEYHLEIAFAWGPSNTTKSSFRGKLGADQVDKYKITIPDGMVQKIASQ